MRKTGWIYGVAFLAYLTVAIILTYPLITLLNTHFIGHPFGDAYEYAHHIWWFTEALKTGQSPFFQPLSLYPEGLSAEWVWSAPLQSFPSWMLAFFMPLAVAYNIPVLLTLALNGITMMALGRRLLGIDTSASKWGAFLAGLIFMSYSAFQGQLGASHTGLVVLYPIPLLLIALMNVRDQFSGRWLIVAGVLFAVSLWGNLLTLFYLVLPVAIVLILETLFKRQWRGFWRIMLAFVIGGMIALPFMIPTLLSSLNDPYYVNESLSVRFSAPLLAVVAPSFYHPLFRGLQFNHDVLGSEPFEFPAYIGIGAGILGMIALWKIPPARRWGGLALVAWIFSLGPLLKIVNEPTTLTIENLTTSIPMPYGLLQNLPILSMTRTSARYSFTIGFAFSLLGAFGYTWLMSRLKNKLLRVGISALLFFWVLFESVYFWNFPMNTAIPPVGVSALAQDETIRAVFDVPFEHPLVDKEAMFYQTAHGQAMIAGHITRLTPLHPARGYLIQDTRDTALLDMLGVDVIIVHRNFDYAENSLEDQLREAWGNPTYEDASVAIFDVPVYSGEAPQFVTTSRINTQEARVYVYTDQARAVTLTGQIESSQRVVEILLEDQVILTTPVYGALGLQVPLQLPNAGFYMITLRGDPTCPTPTTTAVRCRPLTFENITLENTP